MLDGRDVIAKAPTGTGENLRLVSRSSSVWIRRSPILRRSLSARPASFAYRLRKNSVNSWLIGRMSGSPRYTAVSRLPASSPC